MRTTLLTVIITICALAASAQHYSVHSATKGVYAESAGKKIAATKGLGLKASDILCIPEGGEIEILNSVDKRIYRSIRPGRISVTRLLVEARHSATDKLGSLTDHVRFGRTASASGKRVYQEKGMVNRSLGVYDPEGGTLEMDPSALAAIVAARIIHPTHDDLPEGLEISGSSSGDGASLSITNSLGYPVYFNVFSISGDIPRIEISPLGQPGGTYVLLKSQSISRSQKESLPEGERTLVVVTPCQFELDTVIDEINRNLTQPHHGDSIKSQLPVYVRNI